MLSDWRVRELHRHEGELRDAVDRCLFEGDDWILGAEVEAFEREFCEYLGSPHGVGVSNGSDALTLALTALGIGPGAAVIVPAFTYVSTGLAVLHAGASPRFVDVEPGSWTLDPDAVLDALTPDVRAILPVHLFGRAAAMGRLAEIAGRHGLHVVEDAAQGHGARAEGRHVGTIGQAGCFSFHPTKSLGACGDGGFVCTPSAEVAGRLRLLRSPGGHSPEEQVVPRFNHRLDSLQAAILRVKLRHLDPAIARRRELAARIVRDLSGPARGVSDADAPTRVVLVAPRRDELRRWLRKHGIDAVAPYPSILPDLPIFRGLGPEGDWPVARLAARSLIGLTIHPEMTDGEAARLVRAVRAFYGAPLLPC
jgi:dTDP-4-amino-4,6-dideoxygalactose transaminase